VSSTRGPDDLLSVLLLARWAETADRRSGDVPVDVAPLFESSVALERSGAVMQQLLSEPEYQRHLIGRGNHQYVMIGYSASNKECGIVRSRWLVRQAQEGIFTAANAANVDITLVHGQGGPSTRGGSRTDILVRSAPQEARRGRLRITEAGELLNERYGLRPIALRVFEQAYGTLALSRSGVMPRERVEPAWRELMVQLAADSSQAYRRTVLEDATFFDFFRQVTPVDVIERMQIGSRPTTRDERGGVATFRSIPWNHAWSQCRYMLPGWFGAGSALAAAVQAGQGELLQVMYREWFFFQSLIDDIELALGRADLDIARYYDELVAPELKHFSEGLRAEYELARTHILAVTGCSELLSNAPTVHRSIRLRNPYVDPMHLVQADLLRRWREGGREDREMLEALLASVGGIARGLQGS
jgi:phosphoenolpyruvate carboxylase